MIKALKAPSDEGAVILPLRQNDWGIAIFRWLIVGVDAYIDPRADVGIRPYTENISVFS